MEPRYVRKVSSRHDNEEERIRQRSDANELDVEEDNIQCLSEVPATVNHAREISRYIIAHGDNTDSLAAPANLINHARALIRHVQLKNWPQFLAKIAYAEAACAFTQSRSGTIFNHNGILIKTLLKGATEAVLFSHGGISPHQKRFKEKITVPAGLSLHYYSRHSHDTMSGIGYELLVKSEAKRTQPDIISREPVESFHDGDQTYNYRLSNAREGDIMLPTEGLDVISIEPMSYMSIENRSETKYTRSVIDAVKIYRPEIKHIHFIHCRAVYAKNRERIYLS